MVIHLLPDDKYVFTFCTAARNVPVSEMEQLFLVRDPKPYKYLPVDADFLQNSPVGSPEFERVMGAAGKGDRIIIHFLNPTVRNWLAGFNTEASVEWVFWSSDFYTCMYLDYPDYDPITLAFLNRHRNVPLSRFKLLHWYRKCQLNKKVAARQLSFEQMRDAASSKISVFHHYIEEEYALVKQMIPFKAKFNYFFYNQNMSYDEIYELGKKAKPERSPLNINEPNLLVGNCGYPYINHLDSFDYLKDKINGVNVIVPLSYGEQPYIEEVIAQGKRLFAARMVPLKDYMSFNEYLNLLMSCQGMFISLNTAKAMGNILTLLLLGKRVFIKREMLAYAYLKRIGVKVNAIDEFSMELLMQPEDPETIAENAKRIIEVHSATRSVEVVENMIKLVP